jgi:hypothetical protein
VNRFCVKAEKRPKPYIKWEKSTFAEKILKLLYGPIFPILWEKYFFSSKTSSDRLKLINKTKKKWGKKNYVKAQTTVHWHFHLQFCGGFEENVVTNLKISAYTAA